MNKKHIGKLRYSVEVSSEYQNLSRSDEISAEILAKEKQYRQACYFVIQAMEKAIRAKIFTLVNANLPYFRDRNRSHSVEDAVGFLIEIISTDETVKMQIANQFAYVVFGLGGYSDLTQNSYYSRLHNNLRYPTYWIKKDNYAILEVGKEDYELLKNRLDTLKSFLKDLDRL